MNVTSAPDRTALRQAAAQQLRSELQPGSLVVLDVFKSATGAEPHGQRVTQAALDTGFSGPLLQKDFNQLRTAATQQLGSLAVNSSRQWKVGSTLECLTDWAAARRAFTVRGRNDDLQLLAQGGLKNSVVNLSLGSSVTDLVGNLLQESRPRNASPEEQARARGVQAQLLQATGQSTWPQVFSVIGQAVAASSQHPIYLAEKASYDQTVSALVEQGNQLVVASGNEGELSRTLGPIPSEWSRNDLASSETVVAGALDGGSVAPYSNRFPGVTFYADGELISGGRSHRGTSYAAPRVAARLAAAESLEALRSESGGGSVDDGFGQVPVVATLPTKPS